MHKDQSARYTMFVTLQSHFNSHPNAWNTNVPITAAKNHLDTNIALLSESFVIQLENTTGATKDKNKLRKQIETQSYVLSSGASAYAIVANNSELLLQTKYRLSRLQGLRDTELQSVATNLVIAVQPHLTALAPFGITLEMLETLTTIVNLFAKTIILPKKIVEIKREATAKISVLIKQTLYLLNTQLDSLVVVLDATEPEFVAVYRQLRRLRKPNRTQLSLTTTVIDALTQLPIESALLEIPLSKLKRLSSPKGRNKIKNITKGRHKLMVSHKNYKAVVQEFTVIKGETTKLVIKLEGIL